MSQNLYNHKELWENCCRFVRDNIPEPQYKMWFEPIAAESFDGEVLRLVVPSQFFAERLEEAYLSLLLSAIRKVFGRKISIEYHFNVVKDDPESAVDLRQSNDSQVLKNPVLMQNEVQGDPFAPVAPRNIKSQLNPKYTFENYCGSKSNQLALSLAEAIAMRPECKTFSPLLIFGKTGVGKTHLIQAIGIRLKENNPQLRVLYLTARIFQNQYVTAILKNKVPEFINFYQSIDVLIMDDIQELAGQEKTQNIFYHIFNHLHLNQKLIILSSDCPPVNLDGIIPRLMGRFKWGVTAELFAPDFELRRTVLEKRASEDGLKIPAEILDFIAENVQDSVRELEGVILSLITRATFMNLPITIDMARAVISNAIKISKSQITFETIAEVVSAHFGIDASMFSKKVRKRDIADARQILMYLAKKYTGLSSTTIGLRLARDHSTVVHACKTIEERATVDKTLQADLNSLEAALKNPD